MNMPEYIPKKEEEEEEEEAVLKVYPNGFLSSPLIQFSII